MIRILLTTLVLFASFACADHSDVALYRPSPDPMADVDRALTKAATRDVYTLIILGADWCHDSRALARRIRESPLKEVVDRYYETVLVDVGYYEHGRDVTRRFGVPTYYATPTVLIVDPRDDFLINAQDRHRWGGAHDISMAQSVSYFESMAETRSPEPSFDVRWNEALGQIDSWERRIAERVIAGYAVVGPKLRAHKQGNAPADFEEQWQELSKFRGAILEAINDLHEQARQQIETGTARVELDFPDFSPRSWE